MENTSDTKRKSGMELEVKDGALLWQYIEKPKRLFFEVENGRRV